MPETILLKNQSIKWRNMWSRETARCAAIRCRQLGVRFVAVDRDALDYWAPAQCGGGYGFNPYGGRRFTFLLFILWCTKHITRAKSQWNRFKFAITRAPSSQMSIRDCQAMYYSRWSWATKGESKMDPKWANAESLYIVKWWKKCKIENSNWSVSRNSLIVDDNFNKIPFFHTEELFSQSSDNSE